MSGWRKREIRSFRHAFEGIAGALRNERHMRFHLIASIVVVALAVALKATRLDWLWLLAAIAAVWLTELINTAVERAVDLASSDIHPLAKAAKDASAGAVLVAAAFAVAVGAIILGPLLWKACFQ